MKIVGVCVMAAALAGCSWLPAMGPTANTVVDKAQEDNGQARYDIVDVNDQVVATLLKRPAETFSAAFAQYAIPPEQTVAVGDALTISIWEGGSGTLFGETMAVEGAMTSTGSRGVTIPTQVVPRDGKISVPFAGRLPVVGRTAAEVQERIRRALRGKTQDPQVLVSIAESLFNSVTVSGEVVKGTLVMLSPRGEHILDVIASAGGVSAPTYDVFVMLTRGGVEVTIPYQALVEIPTENIYAWPGDVLTLIRRPHTFEAFGAAGKVAQIEFDQPTLSLTEALGKSGGLSDEKADPMGVFLLRHEPLAIARTLAPLSPAFDAQATVPVVYHFDFSDVNSYLLAERFSVEDKDVLYIAPARSDAISKFFALISEFTSPIVSGAVVSNAAK
jgi:polysaccharide export outer membrane protein